MVGANSVRGCILTTSDTGATWTLVNPATAVTQSTGNTLSDFPILSAVSFLASGGNNYFVVVGYSSTSGYATSFTSTNSGATWREGTRVAGSRWYGVTLGSAADTAYAVGYKTNTVSLYKSTLSSSSAMSWTSLSDLSAIQLNDVATVDGVSIIAVGKDRTNSIGVVLYSTDSGASWTKSSAVANDATLSTLSWWQFFSVDMYGSTAFVAGGSSAAGYLGVTTDYGISFDYADSITNGAMVFNVPIAVHAVSALSATEVYLSSSSGYVLKGTYAPSPAAVSWTTSKYVADTTFYSISMFSSTNGIAGVKAATSGTTNSLWMLFGDPTASPTPIPSPWPTAVPSPLPTYSGTVLNGAWTVVNNPAASLTQGPSWKGSCWSSLTTIVLVGSSGDNGLIVTSSDQGSTWSGTSIEAGADSKSFSDVACYSTYAAAVTSQGYIYNSSNSGSSWTVVSSTPLSDILNAITIASDGKVYIASSSGAVYKATAGTWSFTSCSSNAMTTVLYGVGTFDGTLVMAVGAGGVIFYSTDTSTPIWTSSTSGVTVDLYSVSCGSIYSCFVGGDSGTLLRTNDGGTSWTALTATGISGTTASLSFHTVRMIDSKVAFVTASNGVVVSTVNAGVSWVTDTTVASGNTVTTLSLYTSNTLVMADSDGRAYLRLQAPPSGQPTSQPSQQPTRQPSQQPSSHPSSQPSHQPSAQPTGQPSGKGKPTAVSDNSRSKEPFARQHTSNPRSSLSCDIAILETNHPPFRTTIKTAHHTT